MNKSFKIDFSLSRQCVCTFILALLFSGSISANFELTQAQAIARVRSILARNTAGCKINRINSISALRVKAGWRVTAKIRMSASGSPISETAVWLVSERNGSVAQNQITSEIANGCP